ncbi:hypothetical protein [Saccharopolyspora antimicrobica]|uniref:hypothetical protein n=1 Tax=Saccharopolyspora antimicrobica TaxID=455193 RepID=UPI000B88FF1A|nr:hypothetical protein [Saccharopolyspora antimicrobica]
MAEEVGSGTHEGGVRRADVRRAWHRGLRVLIKVVRWVGTAAAALLAVHVVLTIGNANPDNGITRFVASWADWLALGFQDLFMPADPKAEVLLNYGAAALFWLIITSLATRILSTLNGRSI